MGQPYWARRTMREIVSSGTLLRKSGVPLRALKGLPQTVQR